MRFRVTGQAACVQGHAVPGQALLIRHGRGVVEVGAVVLVLLQDGEHAGRCLVPGLAGADGGNADQDAVAIRIRALLGEADNHRHRPPALADAAPDPFARLEVGRRRFGRAGLARAPERHRKRWPADQQRAENNSNEQGPHRHSREQCVHDPSGAGCTRHVVATGMATLRRHPRYEGACCVRVCVFAEPGANTRTSAWPCAPVQRLSWQMHDGRRLALGDRARMRIALARDAGPATCSGPTCACGPVDPVRQLRSLDAERSRCGGETWSD